MAAAPQAQVEVGTFTVLTSIAGLRNGSPWPAAGESIELPLDEAATYVQFGYIEAAGVTPAAEPVAAPVVEPVAEPVAAPVQAA